MSNRVKIPERSESSIGRSCVEWFEEQFPQFEIYKFSAPGRRNVEDYLLIWDKGSVGFIELKKPGERPSEGQIAQIVKHKALGHKATWVDSKGWFMVVVLDWLKGSV
jgi:hypothetical protein